MDSMASDPLQHVLNRFGDVEKRNGYFAALAYLDTAIPTSLLIVSILPIG